MDNIFLVISETSCTYQEAMKMPIKSFLGLVRQIRLKSLMQNSEWREEYLKQKYKMAYKNGNVAKHTKIDLNGLSQLSKTL